MSAERNDKGIVCTVQFCQVVCTLIPVEPENSVELALILISFCVEAFLEANQRSHIP
jgi:hypothetical protein